MRLGVPRLEHLMERLKREINLASTTLKNATYTGFTKGTATGDITAAMSGRTIIVGPLAAGFSDNGSNSIVNILTPNVGTWVEVYCDGTNWFLTGCVNSATNTAVTFADQ